MKKSVIIKAVQMLLFCCMAAPVSNAETASFQIDYLSLEEAEGLVRTQLSSTGRLSAIKTRHLLVVEDDRTHIKKIRRAIHQFDIARSGVFLEASVVGMPKALFNAGAAVGMDLPGGWKKVPVHTDQQPTTGNRRLLGSGDVFGLIVGKPRPIRSGIRHWLSRYDFRDRPGLALNSFLAGLDIKVQLLKGRHALLSIRPWIRREGEEHESSAIDRDSGVLVPPGVINTHQSQVWVSAYPFKERGRDEKQVEISGAETELVVSVGEPVELAAIRGDAMGFGEAALSSDPEGFSKFLIIRVSVSKK